MFGQLRKLYREKKMKYMITRKEKPVNHPINAFDTDVQLVEVDEVPEISENFREVFK